jgi:hypothetical protein
MINPTRILVRMVLNWKFLEIITRFWATQSAIGCIEKTYQRDLWKKRHNQRTYEKDPYVYQAGETYERDFWKRPIHTKKRDMSKSLVKKTSMCTKQERRMKETYERDLYTPKKKPIRRTYEKTLMCTKQERRMKETYGYEARDISNRLMKKTLSTF